jgi:Pectate lyase superfamily protein
VRLIFNDNDPDHELIHGDLAALYNNLISFNPTAGIGQFNVKAFGAVGNGSAQDAAAIQATLDAAETAGGGQVYCPTGTYYLGSTTLSLASNCFLVGDGFMSILLSDVVPTVLVKNKGWATSTFAGSLGLANLRLRCTTDRAGTESPFDGGAAFRNCYNVIISNVWCEGGATGIGFEGCTDWQVENVVGYRQADSALKFNWSGTVTPTAHRGVAVNCWAVESGYQLDIGDAVPTVSYPYGSGIIVSQGDVSLIDCGAIDCKGQGVEMGSGPSGVLVDGFTQLVTQAGRVATILVADCNDVVVRRVKARITTAGGEAAVYVEGTSGHGQDNIVIENCMGQADFVSTSYPVGVNVSDYCTNVVVRGCTYDGMNIQAGNTNSSDILLDDCEVRNCGSYGFRVQKSVRSVVRNCRAINNGADSGIALDVKSRVGFDCDLGTDLTLENTYAADTRAGGARTQTYGYYWNNVTGLLLRNVRAKNNLTAPRAADTITLPAIVEEWNEDGTTVATLDNTGLLYLLKGVKIGTAFELAGTGSPESIVTAPVGSTWRRTDGGASTTFYSKESGVGNTGWVAYGVGAVGAVSSVNTRTGGVVLTSTDVGLGNVDNTSNATERAATATLGGKTLTSPVLSTGVSGTAVDTDSTMAANSDTKLASQKAVKSAIAATVGSGSPVDVIDVTASPYNADRTGVVDSTTGIQAAITATSATIASVYFPKGTYKVSDQGAGFCLDMSSESGVHLFGPTSGFANPSGTDGSATIFTTSNNTTIMKSEAASLNHYGPFIENLRLEARAINTICFSLKWYNHYVFRNVTFQGIGGTSTGTGLKIVGTSADASYGHIETCHFLHNLTGCSMAGSAGATFDGNCYFQATATNFRLLDLQSGVAHVSVIGNKFEDTAPTVGGIGIQADAAYSVNIIGNCFEGLETLINLVAQGSPTISGVQIHSNSLQGKTGTLYGVVVGANRERDCIGLNRWSGIPTRVVDNGTDTTYMANLTGTATWDPPSIANGAATSTTVTVSAAVVGQVIVLGFSLALPAGMILWGTVTAADTVTATLFNASGTTQDVASGTLTARVLL